MINKIVSNTLLKTLAGISGTAQDVAIEYHNSAMTEYLAMILGLSDFAIHTVTDERQCLTQDTFVRLNQFPVNPSGITMKNPILDSVSGYTFQSEQGVGVGNKLIILGSSGDPTFLPYDEILFTYSAGYTVQDKIEVLAYASLVGTSFTVVNKQTAVETNYTFVASGATGNQINANTSNAQTAANIQAKISGSTLSTATVTFPLDTAMITSHTIGTSAATVTLANLPFNLKTAVALLVSGVLIEKQNLGQVASYSIGGKSVNFRSKADLRTFQEIISSYIGTYKQVKVYS